ncbi:unnamed protein product [Parnassius mnemosyne]|uniref:C2H2-type domain-containing protein n=1 Tax=Parnassius mnemosyne TaxID=213953 RepID=A0AAV1M982_9NEOP
MRTLARRGLRAGAASPAFDVTRLRVALHRALLAPHNVYVELDAAGGLCARGGAEAAAVSARLAPAAPHAQLLLCAQHAAAQLASKHDSTQHAQLRLRLATDAAPLHELQLWFDDAALALLHMPFLSLKNIQGKNNYVCHDCGVEFEQPNTLKVHLFLSCREYSLATFWETCIERLKWAETGRSSAFQPYGASATAWPSLPLLPLLPLAAEAAEAAEALAAAWGRSRGGHACLYCGKLYSRKYGLKIHIRTHTGYKPLRCRHCLRAFGDPSNLNKHVRLHGAEGEAEGGRTPARAAAARWRGAATSSDTCAPHTTTTHPSPPPHPHHHHHMHPHSPDQPTTTAHGHGTSPKHISNSRIHSCVVTPANIGVAR